MSNKKKEPAISDEVKILIAIHEDAARANAVNEFILRAIEKNPDLPTLRKQMMAEVKAATAECSREDLLYEIGLHAEAAGLKGTASLVTPLAKEHITVTEDANGIPSAKIVMNGVTLQPDAYINKLKGDPSTGFLFESGAAPGAARAAKNPFRRGPTWNITEQGRIMAQDFNLAIRLKAEAEEAA